MASSPASGRRGFDQTSAVVLVPQGALGVEAVLGVRTGSCDFPILHVLAFVGIVVPLDVVIGFAMGTPGESVRG